MAIHVADHPVLVCHVAALLAMTDALGAQGECLTRTLPPLRREHLTDTFQPAHITAQYLRNDHAAIGLLVILQHCDQGPANGQA